MRAKGHSPKEQPCSASLDLFFAEESERKRIAANLHDEVAQALALSRIRLGILREELSGTIYREALDEIDGSLEHALRHVRSLTLDLSHPELDEFGLGAALESLCEQFQEKYGLIVHFQNNNREAPSCGGIDALLLRTAQELLFNIVKHARASTVRMSLQKAEGSIKLVILDDGTGFDQDAKAGKNSGYGLFSIRERLRPVNGRCDIRSRPGFGTRISITAPCPENDGAPEGAE
jgi:signal transduction histidine kinase